MCSFLTSASSIMENVLKQDSVEVLVSTSIKGFEKFQTALHS